MEYRITGRVQEKESGLGVRGLLIRAYDKDLLYDDLLGTAISDDEGHFEIIYSEKDFRELFESKPDIYLSIYAPPYRFLITTEEAVRWEALSHEHFDLKIDRETLGDAAPSRPDRQVEGGISLPENAVLIEKRNGYHIPRLPNFSTGGIPGAPALPEQLQYVALPLGGDILRLDIQAGDPVRLPKGLKPFPAQEPVPDIGTDSEQFGDGFSTANTAIAFTPPNPKYFESKKPYPEKLVELEKIEEIGVIQIAILRVHPLQYDPKDQSYVFYPHLRYTVEFDAEKAKEYAKVRKEKKATVGQCYTELVNGVLRSDLVVSAKDLYWPILIIEEVPYVIITDNYVWPESLDRGDGTTRAPNMSERGAAVAGDIVGEFEKLAEWKTSCGRRTRVITISEIIGGNFGDFTQNGFARDLQEVLRNFIKYVHKDWGTFYVLLGGDVNVVPIRKLVGCSTYWTIGCHRVPDNPPPDLKEQSLCHFVAGKAVMKLRPYFIPASTDPLSTFENGTRIPFEREAGEGRLGWYFTNETDFNSKNEGFTRLPDGQTSRCIIVEGPESVINDDYYWVRDVNSIPSDLYYASLEGPNYSTPGKHDFDGNNNGLYAQNTSGQISLDKVDLWSDVYVGRASVETGEQAQAFVNKVMTYEMLETPDGESSVDLTYLKKILYASAYWGRLHYSRQTNTAQPPAEGAFTHVAGANEAKLHSKILMTLSGGMPSYRLVARVGNFNIVIPYKTNASATNLGWYFTTDNTYTTQSLTPTIFLKIMGPESEIDASTYLTDPVGLELAVTEKENLRGLINGWYPTFASVERHYSDYFDLAPPPPLMPLEDNTIHASLDNGVHFASLSGHGNPYGCCYVSSLHNFTNARKYFIMFANSCSTARPDYNIDSLAEKSVYGPDGGAVGYVGFTRYGWIGVGDNYEEYFWNALRWWGSLGIAAGLRRATGGVSQLWTIYTQILFGDPSMWVWSDVPSFHEVTIDPATIPWGGTVTITVRKLGTPVSGHRITLMGGWVDSLHRPRVFMTKTTNSFGKASFTLPSTGTPLGEVKVTVTHPNFKPYIGTLTITS